MLPHRKHLPMGWHSAVLSLKGLLLHPNWEHRICSYDSPDYDHQHLQDRWKPAIQLDKKPSITVGQLDATMRPTPQDNQLMSKHRVLGFKPQLRLEWRGQDGQSEPK